MARDLLTGAVDLNYRGEELRGLMFPDAIDLFWSCCVTQGLEEGLYGHCI